MKYIYIFSGKSIVVSSHRRLSSFGDTTSRVSSGATGFSFGHQALQPGKPWKKGGVSSFFYFFKKYLAKKSTVSLNNICTVKESMKNVKVGYPLSNKKCKKYQFKRKKAKQLGIVLTKKNFFTTHIFEFLTFSGRANCTLRSQGIVSKKSSKKNFLYKKDIFSTLFCASNPGRRRTCLTLSSCCPCCRRG